MAHFWGFLWTSHRRARQYRRTSHPNQRRVFPGGAAMKTAGRVMLLMAGAVLVAGLTTAQQPGGFPFGGKGGPPNPATLILNPNVKKDLKLTDEQAEKLPAAVMKAL